MPPEQNERHEQLPTMPGTDGCAPSGDDGNDVTPLMHKVSVQEVASSLTAIKSTFVNKLIGVTVWYSVGASFAQWPAAPEAHRSPATAGSSFVGMLTKNLAVLSLTEDEAENGSTASNGLMSVWCPLVEWHLHTKTCNC